MDEALRMDLYNILVKCRQGDITVSQGVDAALTLIREAGWKSPEEVEVIRLSYIDDD